MVSEANSFVWKKTGDRVCVLRVYGQTPVISIPDTIGGLPVREIGDYCFSGEERTDFCEEDRSFLESGMTRICGNFLERAALPDSVKEVGRLAFYNCRNLRELEIGTGLCEIGGDVFMNCRSLHHIRLRGGVSEKSGVQKLLARISSDVEVVFINRGQVEAKVLYPEYYESYDEIAPAHIFGRNIVGEGFRARQCFKDGSADLASYDIIFEKACAEETEETLGRIAMNRLQYPYSLSDKRRALYEGYVREHAAGIGSLLVRKRELQQLRFLTEQGLILPRDADTLIRRAAAEEWGEGAAALLRFKHENIKKAAHKRYSFEE